MRHHHETFVELRPNHELPPKRVMELHPDHEAPP